MTSKLVNDDEQTNGIAFDSPRAPDALGAYPHARRIGGLIFVSGMGPRRLGEADIPGVVLDAAGRKIGRDIRDQCRQTFHNIRVILEDAGSNWERIVDVTVYL